MGDLQGFSPAHQDAWQKHMRIKSDAAAFETSSILEKLVTEKLLSCAGPMT